MYSGLWHCEVCYLCADVSEEHNSLIFRVLLSWRWRWNSRTFSQADSQIIWFRAVSILEISEPWR